MKLRWLALCAALLFLSPSLAWLAEKGQEGHGKKTRPAPDPEKVSKQLEAADIFAKALAGDDARQYFRVMNTSIKSIRTAQAVKFEMTGGHADHGTDVANPFAEARAKARAKAAKLASLVNDPTWRENSKKLFAERMKANSKMRIIGGEHALEGEYPDCVTVGSPTSFCCTGTLIGPNVVLTAGHCGDGGCAQRIYVGIDANHPNPAKIYKVKKAIVHEKFNHFTLANDLTVLILEKDVAGVTPRKIAATADIEASFSVRLVGFGLTELNIFGEQNLVDVAIASASCDCADCPDKYGCHKGMEMVAGGAGKDSCNGDSGGPAYILKGNDWLLAGATSRATSNSVMNCGDGGIYVRVDKYRDWIVKTAKDNGGKIE